MKDGFSGKLMLSTGPSRKETDAALLQVWDGDPPACRIPLKDLGNLEVSIALGGDAGKTHE